MQCGAPVREPHLLQAALLLINLIDVFIQPIIPVIATEIQEVQGKGTTVRAGLSQIYRGSRRVHAHLSKRSLLESAWKPVEPEEPLRIEPASDSS